MFAARTPWPLEGVRAELRQEEARPGVASTDIVRLATALGA
ncbi:MAG: hypothetical protein QM586_04450 [Xenophilus sp.]